MTRGRTAVWLAIALAVVVGGPVVLAWLTDSAAVEWLAAIGTLAAVGVALWLALEGRLRRPRLVLATGPEKPWWRVFLDGHELRLQIVNESSVPARQVSLRCALFAIGRKRGGSVVWDKPDLVTGASLAWYESGRLSDETNVDLAPGAGRYVSLFAVSDRGAQVMPHGPRRGPASHYRAVIVATGENCTPLRRSIVLSVGGDDDAAVEFGGDEVNDDPFHDPSRTRRIKTG